MADYYWFNIGHLDNGTHQDWWNSLRRDEIIAAGYDNKPDADGKHKINIPESGDIVLAYASTHGCLGYGVIGDRKSYAPAERKTMRHTRKVRWLAVVEDLVGAIPEGVFKPRFGLSHPVATTGKISESKGAKQLREFLDQNYGAPPSLPEEITDPELYPEGAKKQITVNAYERNPLARAQCLAAHGYSCSVCNFNFEDVFGDVGREFVHVHHLTKVADMGGEYKVDPIEDMRPVCANCHAIIHRRKDHYSIEEVKQMIAKSGRGRG